MSLCEAKKGRKSKIEIPHCPNKAIFQTIKLGVGEFDGQPHVTMNKTCFTHGKNNIRSAKLKPLIFLVTRLGTGEIIA